MTSLRKILDKKQIQYKIFGDEIRLKCKKNEDAEPSCYVNEKLGVFHCWSCGAAGDINQFLKHYGLGGHNAFLVALDSITDEIKELKEGLQENQKKFNENELWACKPISECHKRFINYLKDRRIGIKTIEKYHILGCENPGSRLFNRVIFPCFRKHDLIGYVSRAIADDRQPRYLYPHNFDKENYLWPIDQVKNQKIIVIVEGIFDAIRGNQSIGTIKKDNTIYMLAMLGGDRLGAGQINLLHNINPEKIVLCFDADRAGGQLLKKVEEQLRDDFNVWRVNLMHYKKKDFGDMSYYEIINLLRQMIKNEDKINRIERQIGGLL